MLDEQSLKSRAIKDLAFIFDNLTHSTFSYNPDFSPKVNKDLEEACLIDLISEKLEQTPKTQTVLRFTHQNEPVINTTSFSKKIRVIITGTGDSYWIVSGEKSSIPGEIDTDHIREHAEVYYILDYQEANGNYILVNYEDDNGQEIGASNTTDGRPELMEQYRTNPALVS